MAVVLLPVGGYRRYIWDGILSTDLSWSSSGHGAVMGLLGSRGMLCYILLYDCGSTANKR